MKRKVIKIVIKPKDTKIYYSKKYFKCRIDAMNAAISHLKEILKTYGVELNEM